MNKLLIGLLAGLLAFGPAQAQNYSANQGTQITFSAASAANILTPRFIFCDNTTPTQCMAINAAGQMTVIALPSGTYTVSGNVTANSVQVTSPWTIQGTVISIPSASPQSVFVNNSTTSLPNNSDAVTPQTIAANSPVNAFGYVFDGINWDRIRSGSSLGSILINGPGTAGSPSGGVITTQPPATGQVAVNTAPTTAGNTAQVVDLRPDSPGIITLGPATPANSVPTVLSGLTYAHISAATTTTVKSGAGVLHLINVGSLGTVASTATIYDNTTATGTVIGILNTLTLSGPFQYDVAFSTGLTIVTTGTVAPDLTVSWR
jgi:hypothetical protein